MPSFVYCLWLRVLQSEVYLVFVRYCVAVSSRSSCLVSETRQTYRQKHLLSPLSHWLASSQQLIYRHTKTQQYLLSANHFTSCKP